MCITATMSSFDGMLFSNEEIFRDLGHAFQLHTKHTRIGQNGLRTVKTGLQSAKLVVCRADINLVFHGFVFS